MSNFDNELAWALAKLAHEHAVELDLHYESADLAQMSVRDGACLALRRAAIVLDRLGLPVTGAVQDVIARMSAAYQEAYGKPLPDMDPSEEEIPVVPAVWFGRAGGGGSGLPSHAVPVSSNPAVFGQFGSKPTAGPSDNPLTPVLALAVDHLAFELDQHLDDTELFVSIDGEDSAIVALRKGAMAVRADKGWVSERVEGLEARMDRVCNENGLPGLPDLPEGDGAPLGWMIWQAMANRD